MADLRTTVAGISSPNPFWLASAPPTDKAYNVIRAFEAGAIDYVLKPINEERFQKTLERVRYRIFSGENNSLENKVNDLLSLLKPAQTAYLQRITVKGNGRIRFLEVEKIDWISFVSGNRKNIC